MEKPSCFAKREGLLLLAFIWVIWYDFHNTYFKMEGEK